MLVSEVHTSTHALEQHQLSEIVPCSVLLFYWVSRLTCTQVAYTHALEYISCPKWFLALFHFSTGYRI